LLLLKKYFRQLRDLNAEFGAKELLRENAEDIYMLAAGVRTMDIDTQEDYNKLKTLDKSL